MKENKVSLKYFATCRSCGTEFSRFFRSPSDFNNGKPKSNKP